MLCMVYMYKLFIANAAQSPILLADRKDFHYSCTVHQMVKMLYRVKKENVHTRATSLIEQTLHDIPAVSDVRIEEGVRLGESSVDFLVKVWTQGEAETSGTAHFTLLFEVKASGQPRWARSAADELSRYVEQADASGCPQAYGLFIAPYISEAAAEILRDRGHGYLDLAGNGRLAFDGIYVERRGNPNPFSERSELRTLFSPKASRVLRILLMHPYRPWRMAALAEEAGVSLGLVAKVKPLLLNREWADETPQGLTLIEPAEALDAWAAAFQRRRSNTHDYYSFGSVQETEQRLAEAAETVGARYALAEFSGTERLAPHVRYNRAAAYIETEALEEVARRAELRAVETGPNVQLFDPYDAGVFLGARQIGDAQVAHPIQLFLDLKQAKGRGEEAAAFLRSQILEPAWAVTREPEEKP